jgi:hypothetical protein
LSFCRRLTATCIRGIITSQGSSFSSLEVFRKKGLVPDMAFVRQLSQVYSTPNQYIFDLIHKDRLPAEFLEAYWHLSQCITVHALPLVVRQKQYVALCRRYPQVLSPPSLLLWCRK